MIAPVESVVAPAEAVRSSVRIGFSDGTQLDFAEGSAEWHALHGVAATLLGG